MNQQIAGQKITTQGNLFNADLLRQGLVVLALIATIVVNGLANALPLNGLSTGDISDRFNVYFVPAGYVFSIWGVIYLALIAYAVFQALPSQRANPRLARIGYLFVASSLANIVWLFLWHYEQFPLTILAMLALLGSLIAIYLRLGIGRTAVAAGERWLVHLTFSIYLGWVTVATIANATSLLDFLKWSGWGIAPETWTVIMLAAAAIIAALVSLTRKDIAYLLVLVWAISGIAVKHAATASVATAAWIVTGFVVLMIGVAILTGRTRQMKTAG